jgi:uncharacterized protein
MLDILDGDQIDLVLWGEAVGRIGCHAGGRTYVVPVTYVYDGESVYSYSREGLKLRMMRANPEVCFEVDHIQSANNWQSVIAWGAFEELHGAAAERALALLTRRLLSLPASKTSLPAHAARASHTGVSGPPDPEGTVFRIKLAERTGRLERPES